MSDGVFRTSTRETRATDPHGTSSHMSCGQNLVHGEGASSSRVGPYRFCSDGNPTTLSILLWSYLILSDTHMIGISNGRIDPWNPLECMGFSLLEPKWPIFLEHWTCKMEGQSPPQKSRGQLGAGLTYITYRSRWSSISNSCKTSVIKKPSTNTTFNHTEMLGNNNWSLSWSSKTVINMSFAAHDILI